MNNHFILRNEANEMNYSQLIVLLGEYRIKTIKFDSVAQPCIVLLWLRQWFNNKDNESLKKRFLVSSVRR